MTVSVQIIKYMQIVVGVYRHASGCSLHPKCVWG